MSSYVKQRVGKLLVGFFVLLMSLAFNASAYIGEQGVVTEIPPNIAQAFPSATRVGKPLNQGRVTPVYQLNEIIGYSFSSDDFTKIIGFSGETINLHISLDPQGTIIKIKVLKHHEPIFIHGLGEEPMISFIEQFHGHSIKEHFIVDARDRRNSQVTHIDGVTKATVSVLVINDTIIASALTVARSLLSGFAPLSTKTVDLELFKPMTFSQLVNNNYISHWQLFGDDALELAPHLASVIEEAIDYAGHGSAFIDLYVAPLNIPIVGKNLLGEQEYARLIESVGEGSNAFMIFDRGAYPFIGEDFIPQTAPERFKIVQSGLPLDSRDIDFYSFLDPSFNIDIPDVERMLVLNIKSQSGFDVASDFQAQLGIDYNVSFLSREQHTFTNNIALSSSLFIENEQALVTPIPLWQRIWRDRWIEIALIVMYLALIIGLFVRPDKGSTLLVDKSAKPNYLRTTSLLFSLLIVGFYTQGQLSVVNIYTLLLSIASGFDINVFLLDPILFILWSVVFLSLFVVGRGLFCGWLCPFGALQELMATIASMLNIKQWKIDPAIHRRARWIKYGILLGLIGSAFYSLTLAEKLAEVEPFKTAITMNFVRYWPFVIYPLILLVLSLKIHKFYCRYLCPLGAGLAIIGSFPVTKWITRRSECGSPCQLCKTKKCGIDAIDKSGAVNYQECVGCFDCVITINQSALCVIDKYKDRAPRQRRIKAVNLNGATTPL